MKCVNVSLLQEAVKLGLVISDKSSIGAMKDSYIIKLFSWETFIKLLQAQRFDALYIAPFMIMLHVIKSETLNKYDRFEMISQAIRQFYFYLNQVEGYYDDAIFTPSFHSNTSVGTLFGTRDFIIKCIESVGTLLIHCLELVLLPIPQMLSIKSPFDFFISDRKMNKKINKIHNQQ